MGFSKFLGSSLYSTGGEIWWYKSQCMDRYIWLYCFMFSFNWRNTLSSTRATLNFQVEPEFCWWLMQGLMENHEAIVDYFNKRGVSVIFLFRRNLLRRMVSVLANTYDRDARVLNGTHKAHVHSTDEVLLRILYLSLAPPLTCTLALIFTLLLIGGNFCRPKCFQNTSL